MKEDPIMQELRDARRELLKEAGGDLRKLLERANREAPKLLAKYRAKSRCKVGGRALRRRAVLAKSSVGPSGLCP